VDRAQQSLTQINAGMWGSIPNTVAVLRRIERFSAWLAVPTIDQRRAFAQRHVEWGRELIARHRQYVEELKESGRDTEAAEQFLLVLERTQKVFERDLADLERWQ